MKTLFFLLLLISISAINCFAQNKEYVNHLSPNTLHFVPEIGTIDVKEKISYPALLSQKKTTFYTTGWILRSLKYRNAFDQFSSSLLFDPRSFDPINASHLNNYLTKNRLVFLEN